MKEWWLKKRVANRETVVHIIEDKNTTDHGARVVQQKVDGKEDVDPDDPR
jgi:hypothetical protein